MTGLKYYIVEKEYSPAEVIRLASDFGSTIKPKSISRIHETIMESVRYLRTKNVPVKVMMPNGDELVITDVPKIEDVKQIEFKNDNSMMVIFEDGVYEIDPAFLSEECWDVQLFGNPGCQKCEHKNKISCDGDFILKNGHNNIGNEIPLAKRIADRPRREGKK